MSSPFQVFTPISPIEFKCRSDIIIRVCERLAPANFGSTNLVGGPCTGSTSLLRYLTSKEAQSRYPSLAKSWNVMISGDAFGVTATSNYFWAYCFREIQRQMDLGHLQSQVSEIVEKTKSGKFSLYDLEDFFDVCANSNQRVVLFIDDFINLLRNTNFWPPDNFFHQVRSLGQRLPRALAFVVATPRPLIDLWDPGKNASPFYNIFAVMPIGRLSEVEVKSILQNGFTDLGLKSNEEIEKLVLDASGGHPALVNYVADLCIQMIQKHGRIDVNNLYQVFGDPAGPVVALIRRIRQLLSLTERQWLDICREKPNDLTRVQLDLLHALWEYGLLPPGVTIP
jgi:hypothetical protein